MTLAEVWLEEGTYKTLSNYYPIYVIKTVNKFNFTAFYSTGDYAEDFSFPER